MSPFEPKELHPCADSYRNDYLDDVKSDEGWNARGFERVDNVVPVIERRRDGADTVRRMEIHEDGHGVIAVKGLGDEVRDAVMVVSPLARNTLPTLLVHPIGTRELLNDSYSSSKR